MHFTTIKMHLKDNKILCISIEFILHSKELSPYKPKKLIMNKILNFPFCMLLFCLFLPQFAVSQTGASLIFKSGDYVKHDTALGNFGTQNFTIETWLKVSQYK